MKTPVKTLSAAVGAAFISSLAGTSVAASDNPFSMTQLSSGYMVADSQEGKCGEGKCGGDKNKVKAEGKGGEGKCGGMGDKHETKTGDEMGKAKAEGKCGEGKCGGNK